MPDPTDYRYAFTPIRYGVGFTCDRELFNQPIPMSRLKRFWYWLRRKPRPTWGDVHHKLASDLGASANAAIEKELARMLYGGRCS